MNLTVADKAGDTNLFNSAASSTTNRSIPMVAAIGDQSGTWVPGWNISAALPTTGGGSGYIGGEAAPGSGTAVGFSNQVLDGQTAKTVYVGHEAEETDINMTYDVATAVDQAAGVYQNVLTYTVSLN